jgi:hypothetical protein
MPARLSAICIPSSLEVLSSAMWLASASRTPRFRSPQSSAASKRSARPYPPQGRHARHSLDAIASLPKHQMDRSNLSLPSRGRAAGPRRAGAGQHRDDTASIAARVPPTSIKFAWTVGPFCSNCYPFLGLIESFIRHQLQFDQADGHRPIVSCSLVQRAEERPPPRRPKLRRTACLTIQQRLPLGR